MSTQKKYGCKMNARKCLLLYLMSMETLVNGRMTLRGRPIQADIGSTSTVALPTTTAPMSYSMSDEAMEKQIRNSRWRLKNYRAYEKNFMSVPPTQSFEDIHAPAPSEVIDGEESCGECCVNCLKGTGKVLGLLAGGMAFLGGVCGCGYGFCTYMAHREKKASLDEKV
ncbi:hypothetical protein DFH28DRAFT_954777 [Melampsora americana]|nr:hypothetical protein DFH28DRAFT_954777 [Melampsora americana]